MTPASGRGSALKRMRELRDSFISAVQTRCARIAFVLRWTDIVTRF